MIRYLWPLDESDAKAINNNFAWFESLHPEFKFAKTLVEVDQLDYRDERQRMAIGRALVFILHSKEKDFKTSPDYKKALDYLNAEYGEKNVKKAVENYEK